MFASLIRACRRDILSFIAGDLGRARCENSAKSVWQQVEAPLARRYKCEGARENRLSIEREKSHDSTRRRASRSLSRCAISSIDCDTCMLVDPRAFGAAKISRKHFARSIRSLREHADIRA